MDEINSNYTWGGPTTLNPHSRTIIHIDMDYFYAQVEEIRDSSLRNKPFGIQQKSCVVTSNYIARDVGIKKLMSVTEAKELCPHLVLVNGEDLTPYRQMSAKIFEVLHKFSPIVEKLGLDENFLDVSDIVSQRLNGNFDDNIFEVRGCIYPSDGKLLLNNCNCGCNQRLAIGTHIAKEIRQELYKSLGITCCAGISHNKLLAKLIGNQNKPNNQTVLIPAAAESFMLDLNCLSKITGIGQKTESLLLENGIANINDLQNCDLDWLKKTLGSDTAVKLKDLSYGRDPTAVKPTGKPKSISLEDSCMPISVRKDVEERFRLLLMRLIGQVSEDGRIPITLKIIIRKYDTKKKSSHRETKQANILPSLFRLLNDGQIMLADGAQDKLLKIIMRLFDRIIDMNKPFNITLLGLAFSKFQERKLGSSSIANFFIRKTDLEVQSVTSLTNILPASTTTQISPPQSSSATILRDDIYNRRTTSSSPIPMFMDMDSVSLSSDFSDISETEIEPSPKKTRLGLLISKRRCLSPNDSGDVASPSKLRVAELRLNSRDSDKDSPCTSIATAIPIRMFTKSQQQTINNNNSTITKLNDKLKINNCNYIGSRKILERALRPTKMETNNENLVREIGSTTTITDLTINSPITTTASTTIITGNLCKYPSGVDPDVFKELPAEVQNELMSSWATTSTNTTNISTTATASTHKNGTTRTLHRYFIKNK